MATWTQADVDRLKAVIASGAKSVRYDGPPGRSFEAQDMDQMRSLLAEMVADVNNEAGTRQSFRFAATSKGF
jgi:hypothetical protein